jgi:hypothetical protein
MRLRTPFGVSWETLERDHVLAFLRRNEDESLTWEAKGGDIRPHHIRDAASGFGNSELGGILVLGATQDRATRVWTVDHWEPPEAEVDLWVSHCLDNSGVAPRPSIEVRAWDIDGGGKLACVAIWPVSVPPVITSSGQVWERTSSETVKVKDPTALRRLFDRGRAAEDRIARLSNDAADELFTGEKSRTGHAVVLGFAAASLLSELSAQVFRETFFMSVVERAKDLQKRVTAPGLHGFVRPRSHLDQGGVTAWGEEGFGGDPSSYSVRVGRHGGVAVGYAAADMGPGAQWAAAAIDRIRAMWATANDVLESLGALGVIHVAARVDGAEGQTIGATQWSEMSSDGAEEIDRLVRDVQRALGRAEWEPEEEAADGEVGPPPG